MNVATLMDQITAAQRELRQLADDLDQIEPELTIDQKLAITRRLLKIAEVLSP